VIVSANSTVTVKAGSAVVGVGDGGYFIANGQKFPIVGGIEAVVEEGALGEEAVFEIAPEGAGGAGGAAAAAAEEEEEEEELEEVKHKSSISWTSTEFLKQTSTTSLTTSSTSSSGLLSQTSYVVVLIKNLTPQQQADLTKNLTQLAPKPIDTVERLDGGIYFWVVTLTTDGVATVKANPNVSFI
jgi:hypothetical protein